MRLKSTLSIAAIAALSTSIQAREAGEFSVQAGVAHVDPDTSSSVLFLDGAGIDDSSANVQTDTQLGLTFRYMWTDSLAVELLASTPFSHDISADTGALGLGRVPAGDTKHLPPTVSLLWFPTDKESVFQPYLGVGLNYTKFFSEDVSNTLEGVLGSGSLDLDASYGISLSAGMDYALSDRLSINAAVRYIDIGTTATFNFDSGSRLVADVDIDPIVYMIGVGYSF